MFSLASAIQLKAKGLRLKEGWALYANHTLQMQVRAEMEETGAGLGSGLGSP